ncbi:MAG: hypothetical protein PHV16_01180 [Candidatus Nanoarchaeia archaeon]|nr:hypothetical protein [Candidatus Nanoarchaeia archaeon]
MVTKKRAQAAMEFLMTYGWAILVVLVVIGALAYFGVLNPQNLMPEKCTFPMGLYCEDYILREGAAASFRLQNGMGNSINITKISINSQSYTQLDCENLEVNTVIHNGESEIITVPCTSLEASNSKVRAEIDLTYCDAGLSALDCATFSHTMRGELLTRIEE